jgi:hypothetical protein
MVLVATPMLRMSSFIILISLLTIVFRAVSIRRTAGVTDNTMTP